MRDGTSSSSPATRGEVEAPPPTAEGLLTPDEHRSLDRAAALVAGLPDYERVELATRAGDLDPNQPAKLIVGIADSLRAQRAELKQRLERDERQRAFDKALDLRCSFTEAMRREVQACERITRKLKCTARRHRTRQHRVALQQRAPQRARPRGAGRPRTTRRTPSRSAVGDSGESSEPPSSDDPPGRAGGLRAALGRPHDPWRLTLADRLPLLWRARRLRARWHARREGAPAW